MYEVSKTENQIQDFQLPYSFKEVLADVFNRCKNSFKENLMLFLVTGSCSRHKVYSDWSDIDIYVVLEHLDSNLLKMTKIISHNNSIKVGITLNSHAEVFNLMIDAKTQYYLNRMQEKVIYPLYSNDFTIPTISINFVKKTVLSELPFHLNVLKRIIANDYHDNKEVSLSLKRVTAIMRTCLILNDIHPLDYNDVFNKFAQKFNVSCFDVESYILNQSSSYSEMAKYISYICFELIERIIPIIFQNNNYENQRRYYFD